MIEPVEQSLILPRGHVTVDLLDDRGKVVQREEAENFISLQSQKVAKWWQRMMWGLYNPVETSDALGNKPTDMPWFPAQHIACWTDSAAEDAATENGIRGDIVAWASRHPVGSPTGKRGVVDISGSEFKDAYSKWVFNWTGAQGNGTFQSVGWTRIDEGSGFPESGGDFTSVTLNNYLSGTPYNSAYTPMCWDATSNLWNATEYVTGSSQVRIVSIPPGGGAGTQICLLPAGAWNGNPYALCGMTRLGTDFILCGGIGGVTGTTVRRYNSSGTQVWTLSGTLTFAFFYDCTVDGAGNVWTAASDGKLRSHNPSTGAVTNTVTITGLTVGSINGIAYDPADGNFWVCGAVPNFAIFKVTSAGVVISGNASSFLTSGISTASTSPFAGTYTVPLTHTREPFTLISWRTSSAAGTDISRGGSATLPSTGGTLTMKDTDVYAGGNKSNLDNVAIRRVTNGVAGYGNLGTRSRLSAPIVKDSSKTMKITYQFDFS